MKKTFNKKKCDNSECFADWTTKKLKRVAKEVFDSIYGDTACYGMSDIRYYSGIMLELEHRGITIKRNESISFEKI